MSTVKRISVSLPQDLAEFLRGKAAEQRMPVSAVVAELVTQWRKRQYDELMEEGYREFADEMLAFARDSEPLVAELLQGESWAAQPQPKKRHRKGGRSAASKPTSR